MWQHLLISNMGKLPLVLFPRNVNPVLNWLCNSDYRKVSYSIEKLHFKVLWGEEKRCEEMQVLFNTKLLSML